jgi:hypothetical protein
MNRNLRESPLEIYRPSQYTVHNTQYIGKPQEGCVDVGGGEEGSQGPTCNNCQPPSPKIRTESMPPPLPPPPLNIYPGEGGGIAPSVRWEKKI